MIPAHTSNGRLPVGVHPATWAEVAARFSFSPRRRALLAGLLAALTHLADAGCETVYLAGSFVSTKPNPGDIDVCWDVLGADFDAVHPMFLDLDRGRVATKALFGAEFFPTHIIESASTLTFLEFFQQNRGVPVGIIELDLATLEP